MSDTGAPLVEFQDLAVSYGLVQALSGVSGTFRPGPTGLLGPNGAGKTTLLKTLLGFLTPDRGTLIAFGLDPAKEPLEVRRRIGYMPEQDCHVPGMTASAFVAFAGELSGLPRDEAISRAHEVLYYVGLGEARYRNVETYSTGMKQRVKLAQALVHDPGPAAARRADERPRPAGPRGDAGAHPRHRDPPGDEPDPVLAPAPRRGAGLRRT